MKRTSWLPGLVLSCLLFCPLAQAREWLAVGTDFPQLYEQDGQGRFIGLGADLLRVVLGEMGDSVRFELYPWARAQLMVAEGRADILVGPYRTPEREMRMLFTRHAFYRDRLVFYARSDQPLEWGGDYARLQGQRVAAISGWVYGDRFDHARAHLDLRSVEGVGNALLMLQHGRIDLLATNERNSRPWIEALPAGSLVQLQPAIDSKDGYFAFPRREPYEALKVRFDETFQRLLEDGRFARMAAEAGVQVPE